MVLRATIDSNINAVSEGFQTEDHTRTGPEPASKDVHKLRPRNPDAPRHVRLTKTATLNFIAKVSLDGGRRDAGRPRGKITKRGDTTTEEIETATPR